MATSSDAEVAFPFGNASTHVLLPRHRPLFALLRQIEVCGVWLILFVLTRALIPLLFHGSADVRSPSDSPTLVERATYWCFYAFVAAQLVFRPRAIIGAARRCPLPIAMVLLALISTSWSIAPTVTAKSAVSLGITTIFGLYLATRFRPSDFVRLLATVLGASAILSLVFGAFVPVYGLAHTDSHEAWQGIYTQKNTLGQMMMYAALIFHSVPGRSTIHRLLRWGGITLAVSLLLLSQSMSAALTLLTIGITLPLLRRFRQKKLRSAFVLTAVCVACTTLLVLNTERDVALGAVGRDATLTGRTGIWSAVSDRIAEKPLLGYGFGAFWLYSQGPGERVREVIQWSTPNSHSGYLDIAADLGLLGLLLAVGSLAHAWYRAWRRWHPESGTLDDWRLALLFSFMLIGGVDATLVGGEEFVWAMLVTVGASQLDAGRVASDKQMHRAATSILM